MNKPLKEELLEVIAMAREMTGSMDVAREMTGSMDVGDATETCAWLDAVKARVESGSELDRLRQRVRALNGALDLISETAAVARAAKQIGEPTS